MTTGDQFRVYTHTVQTIPRWRWWRLRARVRIAESLHALSIRLRYGREGLRIFRDMQRQIIEQSEAELVYGMNVDTASVERYGDALGALPYIREP